MRSLWTAFQILLTSAVICISNILHRNKIKQYLKYYKYHKVYQDHSKEDYKVVLGIYNLAAQTRPVCLLRAIEF